MNEGNFKAPCLNCQDRHFKCHSGCVKYLEYKKAIEEFNKKMREEKKKVDILW